MTKYYEVAVWYAGQHPLLFVILGLCGLIIALMVYAAKLEEKSCRCDCEYDEYGNTEDR